MKISLITNSIFDGCTYEGDESFRKDLPPGTAEWAVNEQGAPASLIFICPCGCGAICHVPVQPAVPYGWSWNGSMDRPTLAPSILRTTGCRWHGYLRDGDFTV